jgi:ubiquinone/menaquinone biosynthesis C-methylase UbiE
MRSFHSAGEPPANGRDQAGKPPGALIHAAGNYDLTVWFFTFGRERALREKFLRLARIRPGETVLDVGCGTGTLAIAAARHAGSAGRVFGIDASRNMLARARRKAKKARQPVDFREAPAQQLPFEDGSFDLVTSTVMLHHLPAKARAEAISEIARVLKPGGRAFVADFATPSSSRQHGFLAHLHRHGAVKFNQILALLGDAGLQVIDSGAVGLRDMQFALAVRP